MCALHRPPGAPCWPTNPAAHPAPRSTFFGMAFKRGHLCERGAASCSCKLHQLRLGITPPARFGCAMRRCGVNPQSPSTKRRNGEMTPPPKTKNCPFRSCGRLVRWKLRRRGAVTAPPKRPTCALAPAAYSAPRPQSPAHRRHPEGKRAELARGGAAARRRNHTRTTVGSAAVLRAHSRGESSLRHGDTHTTTPRNTMPAGAQWRR